MDLCAASVQNSGPAEDLKTTVMQLRETVLQQKETIMNQRETIRELTSKLSRCEGQALPAAGPGRRPGSKNTMGDVSRGTTDTLAQLGQTLQTLKQRLENLEVCMGGGDVIFRVFSDTQTEFSVIWHESKDEGNQDIKKFLLLLLLLQQYSRGNSTVQTNSLKDLLQNKIDDMEKQVLSRVNTLEDTKSGSRNDTEQRNKVESTLTSLHHRITDLEKGASVVAPDFELDRLGLVMCGQRASPAAAALRIFKQHFEFRLSSHKPKILQISRVETLQGASGTAQFVRGFTNARACLGSKKVIW